MDRDAYLDRWQDLHGTDPRASGLVRGWLSMTYAVARPLAAARVAPDVVTVLGVALAGTAAAVTAAGGHWPVLGAALLGLSGLLDNLDGAVAVLTGRTSRWGALLDAVADRVADAAGWLALWAAGAAPGWALAAAGLGFGHEYARARAQGIGLDGAGAISVSERPTRVAVAAMFLLGAGLHPARGGDWATVGAVVGTVLAAVGLVQLLVALRRGLGPSR